MQSEPYLGVAFFKLEALEGIIGNRWFLYLDEAGNFDFSPTGSKYFIMTCVVTYEPFEHVDPLYSIKCNCLAKGIDTKKFANAHKFHATEDSQDTRNAVFEVIENHLDSLSIFSVIIRKNKTNPSIQEFVYLYEKVFGWLVTFIFNHTQIGVDDEVIIITDALPVQKKQNAVKVALKKLLNKNSKKIGFTYKLYHHRSESDINLQVADYCCWAIQRKWEMGDKRSYNIIKSSIYGEGDLFKSGDEEYYTYK